MRKRQAPPPAPPKRKKMGNVIVKTEEGVFDSKLEHRVWQELKLQMKAGEYIALARQVPFKLRSCEYVADFVAIRPDLSLGPRPRRSIPPVTSFPKRPA